MLRPWVRINVFRLFFLSVFPCPVPSTLAAFDTHRAIFVVFEEAKTETRLVAVWMMDAKWSRPCVTRTHRSVFKNRFSANLSRGKLYPRVESHSSINQSIFNIYYTCIRWTFTENLCPTHKRIYAIDVEFRKIADIRRCQLISVA